MTPIFFDIDGVLMNNIHSSRGWIKRWDTTLEQDLGISHDLFQTIFQGWFLDVLQGRLDFEEEMERWLKYHDYDVKAWQVINYWHEKDTNINVPILDVVAKLSAHPDVKLYTATNQTHARIAYLRDVMGWGNYFTDFYYSARLGCLKYDARYFEQIERELGLNPLEQDILYFDDDPRNIAVSSARGWNAVCFNTNEDCQTHPVIQKLLSD